MKIELVGLPAVGKTTLAKEIGKARPIPTGSTLFLLGILGALRHPGAALALFAQISKEQNPALRRSLFINVWLGTFAKYMRSNVIDQGYLQAILATLPAAGDIPHLVDCAPRSFFVFCEMPEEVRSARLHERGRAPRTEFGVSEAERFAREAPRAYALLREAVHARAPERMLVIDPADPDAAVRVRALLARPRPTHAFLKTFTALLAAGLNTLARIFKRGPEVVVLMYHAVDDSRWRLSVPPAEFARQMQYLHATRSVVPLADVVAYAKGEKQLPRRAVAITFDDGYHDLAVSVLPIIEKLQIPITIFLTAELVYKTNSLGLPRVTEEDMRILQASTFASIESHGRTHPHLPQLDSTQVQEELSGSRESLAAKWAIESKYFAYPYGDRSPEVERSVREAGYEAAFGISEGLVRSGADLYALPRVQVDATMTPLLFRLRLTGALDWNRRIVDAFRAIF